MASSEFENSHGITHSKYMLALEGLVSKEVLVKDKSELLDINSANLINILFIWEFSRKTDVISFKDLGDHLLINQGSSTKPSFLSFRLGKKAAFQEKGSAIQDQHVVSFLLCTSKENSKN